MSESYFIPCLIERGGFSSERTFEIDTHEGGKLVGTANIEYLRTASKTTLDEGSPEYGEQISGFVKCRKVHNIDEQNVLVEVPSADVIHVPADSLLVLE